MIKLKRSIETSISRFISLFLSIYQLSTLLMSTTFLSHIFLLYIYHHSAFNVNFYNCKIHLTVSMQKQTEIYSKHDHIYFQVRFVIFFCRILCPFGYKLLILYNMCVQAYVLKSIYFMSSHCYDYGELTYKQNLFIFMILMKTTWWWFADTYTNFARRQNGHSDFFWAAFCRLTAEYTSEFVMKLCKLVCSYFSILITEPFINMSIFTCSTSSASALF